MKTRFLVLGPTALALAAGGAQAQTELKASHQWPGGGGDVRDEMVQIIKDEVEAADVGLSVRVYPGASLFKPRQQWDAMTKTSRPSRSTTRPASTRSSRRPLCRDSCAITSGRGG